MAHGLLRNRTVENRLVLRSTVTIATKPGLLINLATRLADYGLPLPQQTIVRIEQGSRPLKLEEALAVAEILGVSVNSLAQKFDDEKVAAAAAQIQRSNIIIARTEQGIVDIRERAQRDEKDAYAFIERVLAGKRDAERQLRDAGATQDDDGRWHLNGTVIDV
jgi:transcriptional regulator with XRE-family HTH domain